MKNMHYAQIIKTEVLDDKLEYAPVSFYVSGKGVIGNPSHNDYVSRGWKLLIDQHLPHKDGFYEKRSGFEENDDSITVIYEYVEIPAPIRHWTPLSIKRTVQEHMMPGSDKSLWDALRELLVEKNFLEDFWGAQYIAEDDEVFKNVHNAACLKFGEDFIENVIDQIPVE